MSPTAALGRYAEGGPVPLADVAREAGVPRHVYRQIVDAGLVTPEPVKGRDGRFMVSWDDAVMVLVAVALAAVAGVAIVTMVRTLRGSGARITPEGIVIPTVT